MPIQWDDAPKGVTWDDTPAGVQWDDQPKQKDIKFNPMEAAKDSIMENVKIGRAHV